MSTATPSTEAFLDELYACAAEPDRWDDVMHAMMRLFGTDKAHIGVRNNRTGALNKSNFFGISPTHIRMGVDYYFAIEPWYAAIAESLTSAPLRQGGSRVLHGGSLVPFHAFATTEYYNDFCRHTGTDDCIVMAGDVGNDNTFGMIVNTGEGRLFGEQDLAVANRIAGDLVRAIRLHTRITNTSHANRLGHFWHDSAVALIVVHQRRVEFTNPSALSLLKQGTPVRQRGGWLSFQDPDVQAALDHMASTFRKPTEPSPHILSFPVQADDDSRWLVQLITLKPTEGSLSAATGLAEPSVMIAITPLTTAAAARQNAIQGFIRFTDTEREVLLLLVQGLSTDQIARSTGRKPSTIRWHIRSLIEKLHAKSIADVVRIGALLLPL
jgi:DNA-binding CsgD family transcriptional regulator